MIFLGKMVFKPQLIDKASRVLDACRQQRLTLAVAESCTGGLLAACLTEISGASDIFMGGAVTYSNAAKHDILSVNEEIIEKYGAISEQTAKKMALGTAQKFHCHLTAAITGIAGPNGGSDAKPVGTVYIAVAYNGETMCKKWHFSGNRTAIRLQSAEAALDMLLSAASQVRISTKSN